MKDNLDWVHRDIKTVNEDYYQVIEGTISWGKSYTVNLFEKQLEEKDKEIERLNNILDELEKHILSLYIVGHTVQNATLDSIIYKLKKLKENNNE